jgi:hypothetical protein
MLTVTFAGEQGSFGASAVATMPLLKPALQMQTCQSSMPFLIHGLIHAGVAGSR